MLTPARSLVHWFALSHAQIYNHAYARACVCGGHYIVIMWSPPATITDINAHKQTDEYKYNLNAICPGRPKVKGQRTTHIHACSFEHAWTSCSQATAPCLLGNSSTAVIVCKYTATSRGGGYSIPPDRSAAVVGPQAADTSRSVRVSHHCPTATELATCTVALKAALKPTATGGSKTGQDRDRRL